MSYYFAQNNETGEVFGAYYNEKKTIFEWMGTGFYNDVCVWSWTIASLNSGHQSWTIFSYDV